MAIYYSQNNSDIEFQTDEDTQKDDSSQPAAVAEIRGLEAKRARDSSQSQDSTSGDSQQQRSPKRIRTCPYQLDVSQGKDVKLQPSPPQTESVSKLLCLEKQILALQEKLREEEKELNDLQKKAQNYEGSTVTI